jgi:hypothetical protein
MKKKLLALAGISSIALFAGTLFADNDAAIFKAANTSIDSAITAVETAGLTNVKSVEFDDQQWEVSTQKNNMETEYVLDQSTSKLTQTKQETEHDLQPPADLSSLKNAVKVVQDKGYTVYSVDFEGSSWEVEGYDAKNLEYTVLVNIADGKILNTSIDD